MHRGHGYVPGIDGLRALAVVAVLVFHLVPAALPGGYVGVDIFFVISGYVVTGSLLRDAALPLPRFLLAFYARRFRRIVPALVVCLCVTVLASVALIPQAWLSESLRSTALSAFFGLSNFALVATDDGYFAPRSEFNPFTHTWSLAVEEQFYLLFPFIAFLIVSRPQARVASVFRGVFIALCLASLAWAAWTTRSAPSQAYYMLASRFWELGVGSALCLFGGLRMRLVAALGARRTLALGLALALVALFAAERAAFPFPWALPAVAGAALLIAALVEGDGGSDPIARWLACRPMVYIGLLSYSLYLWHWPIYTLLRWTVGLQSPPTLAAALVLTGLAAWLSYRWVEQPGQHHPLARRLPAWGSVAAGAVLVGLGWSLSHQVYEHPWRVSQSVVTRDRALWYPDPPPSLDPHEAGRDGCLVRKAWLSNNGFNTRHFVPADCAKPAAQAGAQLIVAGDSHAAAYDRLLYRVAASTGLSVVTYSQAGCGLANVFRASTRLGPGCEQHNRRLVAEILARARPGDVVWLASLRVPRFGDQWASFDRAEVARARQSAEAEGLLAEAEAEAAGVMQQLTQAGLRVVIDAPKPLFPSPAYRCADSFNRMNPACEAGLSMSRSELEEHRAQVVAAIGRLAAREPVHVWDPLPLLCPGETCQAFDGARPLYFDGDHLSGHGNEVLAPHFVSFLQSNVLPPTPGPAERGRP